VRQTKITSTSSSLTQEVSQNLNKAGIVAVNLELDQLFACCTFQSDLLEFKNFYWKPLLRPLLFHCSVLMLGYVSSV